MKAQSDLAGDGKSMAEMTMPRLCEATTRKSKLINDMNSYALASMNDLKVDITRGKEIKSTVVPMTMDYDSFMATLDRANSIDCEVNVRLPQRQRCV